ncbi:MAG: rubrerythrin family protein [Bacteroidota bacterium]
MKKMRILQVAVISLLATVSLQAAPSLPAGGETVKNMKEAFTGETTASAKYAAFAKKAREEGHPRIALLFDAASKAESIHAGNHKAVLLQMGADVPVVVPAFDVKTTSENLKAAIEGESYEVTTMYPGMIKTASAENANLALISLNYAFQVEKRHQALYEKALKALNDKTEQTLPTLYMICTTCGNTYEGEAPERCGISMTPKERFEKISL